MPTALPHRRLHNVLRLARLDALSLVVVAAPAAVVTLCTGDRLGAAIGFGVTLCGLFEWQGRRELLRRRIAGIAWLCSSQLLCLSLILAYAWYLAHLSHAEHLIALLPSFAREQLAELFGDPESVADLLLTAQRLTAATLALTTLLYQGGMAFYYLRSAPAVRAAFAEPPVLPGLPTVDAP